MKTILRIAAWALAAASWASPALAQGDPETPLSAPGVQVVSVEEVQKLIGKARFYDMRAAINYGKGHIRGALALPYSQRSEKNMAFDGSKDHFDLASLPKDKATLMVFYSDGPTGWKAYKAAVLASKAGYTNIKWMREGTAGWIAKGAKLE